MKNKIYLQLFAEGAGEAGGAEVETGLEGQNCPGTDRHR